jgi:predicted nucleic-acid-binding Zn-ribbon protein
LKISDRIEWICQKCGEANYLAYGIEEERKLKRQMQIELEGASSRDTCINCLYQRNPKTRVSIDESNIS